MKNIFKISFFLTFIFIFNSCSQKNKNQVMSENDKNNLENQGKIENDWIILSDGKVHDFESNLIRRLSGLLYISDIHSGNARKRALDKIQI